MRQAKIQQFANRARADKGKGFSCDFDQILASAFLSLFTRERVKHDSRTNEKGEKGHLIFLIFPQPAGDATREKGFRPDASSGEREREREVE